MYYLHIIDRYGRALDNEGHDVATIAEARIFAVAGIRDLLAAELLNGHVDFDGHIEIVDEAGACVDIVHFADAVRISGAKAVGG